MTAVLLVTCAEWPDGEPEGGLLVRELAARGVDAAWAVWDDPAVDWAAARMVWVRSLWDYERRRDQLVDWARRVQDVTTLVNTAAVIEWNTDKAYLLDLQEAGLPVVPTTTIDSEFELGPAVAEVAPAVVKPRVGAGGRGVVVFDLEPGGPEGIDESQLVPGPWVVQPLVESVRTEGETSVFVLGDEPVSQVRKLPSGGEIRVNEQYGGRSDAVPLDAEAAGLATRAVTTAEGLLHTALPYARVDMVRMHDGELVVGEVELVEPGLYLDVVPGNAAAFAELVAGLLR